MRDYLSIGPTPTGEDCAQVGSENYLERARRECKVFIAQLKRVFGEPPFGAHLSITSNPHDFGSYLDVAVVYHDDVEEAVKYAFKVEAETPEYWDEEAKKELDKPVQV